MKTKVLATWQVYNPESYHNLGVPDKIEIEEEGYIDGYFCDGSHGKAVVVFKDRIESFLLKDLKPVYFMDRYEVQTFLATKKVEE